MVMGLAKARSKKIVQGIEHIRNARLRPQHVTFSVDISMRAKDLNGSE